MENLKNNLNWICVTGFRHVGDEPVMLVTYFRHVGDENLMQIVFFENKLKMPKQTYIFKGSTFCDFLFRHLNDEKCGTFYKFVIWVTNL
jgi:hypothetical protein